MARISVGRVCRAPKTFSPFCRKKGARQRRRQRELVTQRRRYDRERDFAVKRLYGRVRWKRLRLRVLERDGWLCQTCLNVHDKETVASVVDHIVAHKGDLELFYPMSNLRALCKSCHDSKTARQDGGFGNAIRR